MIKSTASSRQKTPLKQTITLVVFVIRDRRLVGSFICVVVVVFFQFAPCEKRTTRGREFTYRLMALAMFCFVASPRGFLIMSPVRFPLSEAMMSQWDFFCVWVPSLTRLPTSNYVHYVMNRNDNGQNAFVLFNSIQLHFIILNPLLLFYQRLASARHFWRNFSSRALGQRSLSHRQMTWSQTRWIINWLIKIWETTTQQEEWA